MIVKSATGVFADGTPFDAPGNTPLPPPLTIRPEHLDQVIYLAVPVRLPNCEETTFSNTADSMARYQVFDTELRDSNSVGLAPESVQLNEPAAAPCAREGAGRRMDRPRADECEDHPRGWQHRSGRHDRAARVRLR